MDLDQVVDIDVRPLLSRDRDDLVRLLRGLSAQEWNASSRAPGWTVKALALHLLDDDLSLLSRGRDNDQSSLLVVDDQASLVTALAAKNQRWVDVGNGLSSRVITELLEFSGQLMDDHLSSLEPSRQGFVIWASDAPVPIWFDMARDLTERWVHQMQIREAVGRVEGYASRYLATVLKTFVWALPHQYRAQAPEGTTVEVDLSSGGVWQLTSDGASHWALDERTPEDPDVVARFSDDAGWRWFTGGELPSHGVSLIGPTNLCQPLLNVRGIIV